MRQALEFSFDYDYPCVAPESPTDLFDSSEIDELLTLSILALTDEEKID